MTEELKNEYRIQLADIARKSEELGRKEQELKDKEQTLNAKAAKTISDNDGNRVMERDLLENEYLFYCDVLGSGHCKAAYVKEMGQEFWEEKLKNAIAAGAKIGKSEHDVNQKVSYAMVSIYIDFKLYDKAYDFLVEQATGYAWLNLSVVQEIVREIGYCDRLKSAIYGRLSKNNLSSRYRSDFERIKNWLVFEYNGRDKM